MGGDAYVVRAVAQKDLSRPSGFRDAPIRSRDLSADQSHLRVLPRRAGLEILAHYGFTPTEAGNGLSTMTTQFTRLSRRKLQHGGALCGLRSAIGASPFTNDRDDGRQRRADDYRLRLSPRSPFRKQTVR